MFHAPRPLARAVQIIFLLSIHQRSPLRVNRAINAIGCAANVSTGKIIYDGPRHIAADNHPAQNHHHILELRTNNKGRNRNA